MSSQGQGEKQKEQTPNFSSSKVSLCFWKSWLLCKENFQKKLKPRRKSKEERTIILPEKSQTVGYSQQSKFTIVEFWRATLDCFQDIRSSHKASPYIHI